MTDETLRVATSHMKPNWFELKRLVPAVYLCVLLVGQVAVCDQRKEVTNQDCLCNKAFCAYYSWDQSLRPNPNGKKNR